MNKLWLSAPALFLAACTGGDLVPVELQVAGAKEVIVYRIDPDRLYPWDTVQLADGVLDIELPLDSSGSTFYAFSFDNNGSLRLGIERGDDIEGEVSVANNITTYSLTGSPLSERLLAHYQPLRHSAMLMDSLDAEAQTYQGLPDVAEKNALLFARYQARVEKHRKDLEAMITEDPSSLANIFAIYQSVGNYPLFNPEQDAELIRTTADAMSEAHPNHPILQIFIQSAVR
jgi:hypothetical protein